MAWRYRKSVKLLPGVRLNLGKKSTSVSFGGRGHTTTINTNGRVTRTIGIPGTGISHTSTIRKKGAISSVAQIDYSEKQLKSLKASGTILQVLSVIIFALSLLLLLISPASLIFTGFAIILFILGRKYRKKYSETE